MSLNQPIEKKLGSSNIITKSIAWITGTVAGPITSFFKKNGFNIALAILAFIFLFKIGEAFLGRMSVIFYKEMGFTKSDIALYSKGLGWITTVIFTLLGGLFAIRAGVIKAMLKPFFLKKLIIGPATVPVTQAIIFVIR